MNAKSNKLQVERFLTAAKLPQRAHAGDLCWDFFAATNVVLLPGQTAKVSTGLKLILPPGYGMILHERSGRALKSVVVGAGVIDNGYRGPLDVVLRYFPNPIHQLTFHDPGGNQGIVERRVVSHYYGDDKHEIKIGDKIAQGRLVPLISADVVEVDSVDTDTDRGEGGFGSTDEPG